jgi:hypothetical protein
MTASRTARTPETVFEVNRFTARLWVIFGFAAVVQGLATAAYFIYWAQDAEAPLRVVVAGCGVALAFFGQYFAREALARLRDPHAAIVIGPAGLHDRMLSARTIPWSAISGVAIRTAARGGRFVVLEIAPAAARTAGIRFGAAVEAPINRALGYSAYRIHMLGVKADPDSLVAAMSPYVAVV